MATTTKTIDKWKKKKWYTIKAPKVMDGRDIGHTPAEKPETLMNRTILINSRDLGSAVKRQTVVLTLQVTDVQGLNAMTELTGFEVPAPLVKKLVRRRKSKVEVIQNVTLVDGKKGRLKTLVLYNFEMPRSVETKTRQIVTQETAGIVQNKHLDELLVELLFGNAPNVIGDALKNLGPVKKVEFISFKSLKK